MYSSKYMGFYQVLCIIVLLQACVCDDEICDRRPLGTKTDPLPPDNQFLLEIDGIYNNLYIPTEKYIVRLRSRNEKSAFIAFTISLREESVANRENPRKPTLLNAGHLGLMPNSSNTKFKPYCNDTIVESDITPKTFVEALWTAPEKDNQCVTIFAVVAVRPNVWYSFEGPLSKRVCEDRRKADDMQPMENDNCRVCEHARYQLTFEGMWSYNTHPQLFPGTKLLARFSDLVGASHSKDFSLYKYTSVASPGLKMLAEQGNSTQLELEIQEKLGKDVRTVIKASAPPQTNMVTITNFRATNKEHMVSLAIALLPSPDWFLGVANFELCDIKTNQWIETVRLNLYPLDAGTDKGLTFNSPNEEMSPPQPVSGAVIAKDVPKEEVKPFAKLQFDLIRTYNTPNCTIDSVTVATTGALFHLFAWGAVFAWVCIASYFACNKLHVAYYSKILLKFEDFSDGNGEGDGGGDGDGGDDGGGEGYKSKIDEGSSGGHEIPILHTTQTTTTSEEPPSVDPESTIDCPMSTWEEWLPCEGECDGGKLVGIQIRFRYHMVDGAAVGKYTEGDPSTEGNEAPQYCVDKYPVSETRECEETCEIEEAEAVAERRIWRGSFTPEQYW